MLVYHILHPLHDVACNQFVNTIMEDRGFCRIGSVIPVWGAVKMDVAVASDYGHAAEQHEGVQPAQLWAGPLAALHTQRYAVLTTSLLLLNADYQVWPCHTRVHNPPLSVGRAHVA